MPAEDHNNAAALIATLRAEFIERTWLAVAVMAGIAAVAIPLRALTYLGWTWTTDVALGLIAVTLAGFFCRRRMLPGMRSAFPVVVLMLAAVGAILRNGLQDNGLTYLVMVNVMVTTLFSRRVVLATFLLSVLVMLAAAAGFISGRFRLQFGLDYAASPLGWGYTMVTVFSLGYVILTGIGAYRRSLQVLLQRVATQREEIARLADTDPLTGLATSRVARDRLQMACNQAARKGERVGLLFIDLNGFKEINDAHGHRVGDLVLTTVAARLNENVRSADTAARQGGDEFVVIVSGIADVAALCKVAAKIVSTIEQPVGYESSELRVGASIGIAVFPEHATTPMDLLHAADLAMYQVKQSGKSGYAIAARP